MREVKIGTQNFTKVVATGEPGEGGAYHQYKIMTVQPTSDVGQSLVGNIRFQNGPVKQAGVNGCHQEDLIAIVIDRLQHFQKGKFACRENTLALANLEEAMRWLNHRTAARVSRGVEGTNAI